MQQQTAYHKDLETSIVFNNSRMVDLSYNYTTASIFSIFNEVYVAFGSGFYHISLNNETLEINKALEFTDLGQDSLFVEVAEYNNFGVIFVPFSNGISHIYGRFRSLQKWNLIQSIQNERNISGAVLFEYDNNLYLCIASSMGLYTTTIFSLLKWNGAHFDEIDQVHTISPSNVAAFQSQGSQYIIFLENSSDIKEQSNLVMYELREDHLERVHLLRARGSDKIMTYKLRDIQYVAIFSSEKNSTLYWWNDSDFIFLKSFGQYEDIHKILINEIHNILVLFVAQKNNLLVFIQSQNDIQLIYKASIFEHSKSVVDMQVIRNGNTHVLLVIMQSCDNKLSYTTMPFVIHFNKREFRVEDSKEVLICFKDLESVAKVIQYKLDHFIPQSDTNIELGDSMKYFGLESLGAQQAPISSRSIISEQVSAEYQDNVSWITTNVKNIQDRIEDLNSMIGSLYVNGSQVYGRTIVKGKLYAEELFVKNLHVNYLNSKRWMPHTWLSYTKPQSITGEVHINDLITTSIETEHFLNDILFYNGNQNLTGNITLQMLTANQLNVTEINDIQYNDIHFKSKTEVIQGIKTLSNISAEEILYINQHNLSERLHLHVNTSIQNLNFSGNLNVHNLYVEEINNINWEQFKKDVFRLRFDNRIAGDLTITNMTKVDNLLTQFVSNIDTKTLFTTSSNQIITSNIQFGNVVASNILCHKINNITMDEIVTSRNTVIKGPVTIDHVHVAKHLHMNGSVDEMSLTLDGDHIVGTKESDLMQFYNKNVKIHGNIYVSNILISKTGTVIVNNSTFRNEDVQDYWLKSHSQVIPVHIEPKKGISASHLTVISLNNIGLDNYLVNGLEDKLSTNIIFENVTIGGNVFLNQSVHHAPNLQILDAESIKTTGSFNIIGQKTIQGVVSVSNLITNYLDETDLNDAVTTEIKDKITGVKHFNTLLINGNLVSKNISAQFLNNINLKSMEKEVLYLDEPAHLISMSFSDIKVENLKVVTMNNVDLIGYIHYLNRIHEITAIKDLFINGNISITNAQNVTHINNYNINNVLNKVIDQEHHLPIQNAVRFLGNVHADNIEVTIVNNVHFPSLVSRLFYRSWAQNISVPFTFDKIITPNIFVSQINNIPTNKLINTQETKAQNLLVWGGLKVAYAKFLKSLTAEKLPCNLNQAVHGLKSPPIRLWNLIRISQNATFWDKSCDLANIFHNTVNNGKHNIITEQVTFENEVSGDCVIANSFVNEINVNELINDVVFKNAENQVISGYKTFKSLSVSNAVIDLDADIPTVNNIDVRRLNDSIVFRNNINSLLIKGMKTFIKGFETNQLITSSISNLLPNDLVNFGSSRRIPEAYFHSLEITKNFDVEFVNNISLIHAIQDRVLCCSNEEQVLEGIYYFDTTILAGNTIIPFLNKLPIDDIVFHDDVQIITSPKTFVQDLKMLGKVEIEVLNGESLSERYRQSVHVQETSIIKGNLILNNATLVTSDIKTEYVNGISVEYIAKLMKSKIPVDKTKHVYDVMSEIQNIIGICLNVSNELSNKLLYLEKSTDLQISIPNAVGARAVQLKNNMIFNIMQSEPGVYCGLPNSCTCSTQSSIQISEEQSINTIAEVGVKRVFSYENMNMSSHLFTNSISYSDFCRSQTETVQNETTALMWMLYTRNNSRSSYFYAELLTGFISGVEYFTFSGNTYMVVSRFYDPINNTNSLDCRVYKFRKDEDSITLIQVIDTRNAWTIHVFPTAQGIVLIIGSINPPGKSTIDSGAGVYRFNAKTENFEPLRRVSNTVMSGVGVALNGNSLIVLSVENAIEILKYHPKYDNYYYYQHIHFETVVIGISTFYSGDYGLSDVYLCVVTEDGAFYIYSFQYIQGWKQISKGEIDGLRLLVPFVLNNKHYIFAVSNKHTFLLTAVIHGRN